MAASVINEADHVPAVPASRALNEVSRNDDDQPKLRGSGVVVTLVCKYTRDLRSFPTEAGDLQVALSSIDAQ